jgi:hypothetical protein
VPGIEPGIIEHTKILIHCILYETKKKYENWQKMNAGWV